MPSLAGDKTVLVTTGSATAASAFSKSRKPGLALPERYGSYNFTANDDRLQATNAWSQVSGLTNTLAMWLRIDTYAANGWIIFDVANTAFWQFQATALYVSAAGSGAISLTTAADGIWRHYVMTSVGNVTTVYVNGVLNAPTGTNGSASIASGNKTITLGDYNASPGGAWSGTGVMNDIVFWGKRGLNAREAAILYREALRGYHTMWNRARVLQIGFVPPAATQTATPSPASVIYSTPTPTVSNLATQTPLLVMPRITPYRSLRLAAIARQHPRAQGIAAWWNMTDPSGLTALDASANALHGFLVDAQPMMRQINGVPAPSVSLNGTTSLVRVHDSPPLRLQPPFSITAWVQLTKDLVALGLHAGIVGREQDGSNSPAYDLVLRTNMTIRFTARNPAGTVFPWWESSVTVPVGSWMHIVTVVYGITGTAADVVLYLNGVQDTGAVLTANGYTAGFTYSYLSIQDTVIGVRGGNVPVDSYFPGEIGGLRLYARALTAADVQSLYTAPTLELDWARLRANIFLVGSPAAGATLTATPSPVSVIYSAPAPKVSAGTATLHPAPAVEIYSAPVAKASAGASTVRPVPAVEIYSISVAKVSTGAATLRPAPAVEIYSTPAPRSSTGTATLRPAPAVEIYSVPVPKVSAGAATLRPVPAVEIYSISVAKVSTGAATLRPAPAVEIYTTKAPVVSTGTAVLHPTPVLFRYAAPQATATVGGQTARPTPAQAIYTTHAALLSAGAAVAHPAPVVDIYTTRSPAVSSGSAVLHPVPVQFRYTTNTIRLTAQAVAVPTPVVDVYATRTATLSAGSATARPSPVQFRYVMGLSTANTGTPPGRPTPAQVVYTTNAPILSTGTATIRPTPVLFRYATQQVTITIATPAARPTPVTFRYAAAQATVNSAGVTAHPTPAQVLYTTHAAMLSAGTVTARPTPVIFRYTMGVPRSAQIVSISAQPVTFRYTTQAAAVRQPMILRPAPVQLTWAVTTARVAQTVTVRTAPALVQYATRIATTHIEIVARPAPQVLQYTIGTARGVIILPIARPTPGVFQYLAPAAHITYIPPPSPIGHYHPEVSLITTTTQAVTLCISETLSGLTLHFVS
jgi:hypothetical protein